MNRRGKKVAGPRGEREAADRNETDAGSGGQKDGEDTLVGRVFIDSRDASADESRWCLKLDFAIDVAVPDEQDALGFRSCFEEL